MMACKLQLAKPTETTILSKQRTGGVLTKLDMNQTIRFEGFGCNQSTKVLFQSLVYDIVRRHSLSKIALESRRPLLHALEHNLQLP